MLALRKFSSNKVNRVLSSMPNDNKKLIMLRRLYGHKSRQMWNPMSYTDHKAGALSMYEDLGGKGKDSLLSTMTKRYKKESRSLNNEINRENYRKNRPLSSMKSWERIDKLENKQAEEMMKDRPKDLSNVSRVSNISPDKYVKFEHGGGKQLISDIRSGKSPGYNLEHSKNKGIQVHQLDVGGLKSKDLDLRSRSNFYAKKAFYHGDRPSILNGSIKSKKLETAINSKYESGIKGTDLNSGKGLSVKDAEIKEDRLPESFVRYRRMLLSKDKIKQNKNKIKELL